MLLLPVLLLWNIWPFLCFAADSVQLMSTNENFMSVIAGFTVRLQCSVHRCGSEQPTVKILYLSFEFYGILDCMA